MLGTLDPNHRKATVVGAGIAGMLAADALDRAGYEVTLLEASDRAGGLIRTTQTKWGPAEAAAHSLLAFPAVVELCERLGVKLLPVRNRARWIWRGGRLRKFPLSLGEAFRAFCRACLVLSDRGAQPESLTLEQWARRHLGEPALNYLMVPFVRGIYGARPSELNVAAAFPSLWVPPGNSLLSWWLRRFRMRILGRAPGEEKRLRGHMMAPEGGMEALVRALETSLRARLGMRFQTGAPVRSVPDAPNVVLCVPARAAAELLEAADAKLAAALRSVAYAPLVSITAFVERQGFPARPPQGVGVLLPEGTGRKALGVLFNSSTFEGRALDEAKWVSLTVMMGGTAAPEMVGWSDDELVSALREDLEKILDLRPGARVETRIHRWERAIPRYDERLLQAWGAAREGWCGRPGRVVFGNYAGQVSIRGMTEEAAKLGFGGKPALSAKSR